MNWKLGTILLTLLLFAFGTVHADTVPFEVSGTLTDGAALSGTMAIDDITGTVTTFSFAIGPPDSLMMTVLTFDNVVIHPEGTFWLLQTSVSPGPYPSLSILFPTSTLVGYNGGPICSLSNLCGGFLTSGLILAAGVQGPQLTTGTATVVPEPSAILLVASGLLGVAGEVLRKLRC